MDKRRLTLTLIGIVAMAMMVCLGSASALQSNSENAPGTIKKKGVALNPGSKEVDDVIAGFAPKQRATNIENAKKFGVKDPAAIMDAHEKNLAKWKVLSKDIGRDINKFAEAMNREVYSKVDPDKL